MRLLIFLLLITASSEALAQFSYRPKGQKKTNIRFDKPRSEGVDVAEAKSKYEAEEAKMDSVIKYSIRDFRKADKKVKEYIRENGKGGDSLKNLTNRLKWIYLLHKLRNQIDTIELDSTSNFRKAKAVSAQGLAGVNVVNNNLSENNSGALELGARMNNTRISLPTMLRYEFTEIEGTNQFNAKRIQRDKYLYLDFISRGLITLDSLQNSMSEYINTTQGSPLSLRFNFQNELSRSYLNQGVTGRQEPRSYFNLDFDGRIIPITSASTIESTGISVNIMPTLVFVLPSGPVDSDDQEDVFVAQLTVNAAIVSNNVKNAISLEGDQALEGNILMSAEIRAGNYSDVNAMRNWSLFAKYTFQDIVGSSFTFGFSFAPQGKGKESGKDK